MKRIYLMLLLFFSIHSILFAGDYSTETLQIGMNITFKLVDTKKGSTGTTFHFRDQYFITAAHCVMDLTTSPIKIRDAQDFVIIQHVKGQKPVTVSKIHAFFDKKIDLAILEVPNNFVNRTQI